MARVEVTSPSEQEEVDGEPLEEGEAELDALNKRAPRELKAFAQVAVAAGTTETVSLILSRANLAYFDSAANAWVVEPTD